MEKMQPPTDWFPGQCHLGVDARMEVGGTKMVGDGWGWMGLGPNKPGKHLVPGAKTL